MNTQESVQTASQQASWSQDLLEEPTAFRLLFILHSLIQVSVFTRRQRRPVLPPLSLSVGRDTSHLITDPISLRTPSTSEGQWIKLWKKRSKLRDECHWATLHVTIILQGFMDAGGERWHGGTAQTRLIHFCVFKNAAAHPSTRHGSRVAADMSLFVQHTPVSNLQLKEPLKCSRGSDRSSAGRPLMKSWRTPVPVENPSGSYMKAEGCELTS